MPDATLSQEAVPAAPAPAAPVQQPYYSAAPTASAAPMPDPSGAFSNQLPNMYVSQAPVQPPVMGAASATPPMVDGGVRKAEEDLEQADAKRPRFDNAQPGMEPQWNAPPVSSYAMYTWMDGSINHTNTYIISLKYLSTLLLQTCQRSLNGTLTAALSLFRIFHQTLLSPHSRIVYLHNLACRLANKN